MGLSRKRKKELRKLQDQANKLWESQQVIVGQAGDIAREASRQLGHYNREQVVPTVQKKYETYAAPYVDKGVKGSRRVFDDKVLPATGAVVGTALSVWDAANETRGKLAAGKGLQFPDAEKYAKLADKYTAQQRKKLAKKLGSEPQRSGMGPAGVIALILGITAAVGVLYAAWQTLRADDELWVADDPLAAPDA